MKKKVRLILIIAASCCFFALVYWVSYKWTYEDLQNNKLYDENQLSPPETTTAYTPALQQMTTEAETENPTASEVVTAKTTYILEKYNEFSGELTKEIISVPIELLGLDYDKLVEYAEKKSGEYTDNRKLELVAFERDLLVLRQTFMQGQKRENYSN